MNTSTRFAMATHILTTLYMNPENPVPSKLLAGSVNTSAAVIRQVLMRLAEANLVCSKMGPGGGSFLARDPHEITLLDIWRATESEKLVSLHRNKPGQHCCVGRHITEVLEGVNDQVTQAFFNELEAQTIGDIGEEIERRRLAGL